MGLGVDRDRDRMVHERERLVQAERRSEDRDLVARIQQRGEGGSQRLGGPAGHDDLIRLVRQARSGHVARQGAPQLWRAGVRRIVGGTQGER